MEVTTTPNAARGEVQLTVGGQQFPVRFSLSVLHDYTRATGYGLTDIAVQLGEDLLGTIGQLLTCAVRRYVPGAQVPADFGVADALDLMEDMNATESDAVAEAIWAAIKVDQNPLLAALIAKAPKSQSAPSDTGASSSTSLSAN